MLYFYSIARDEMDYTNAIIVSHGPATASSITSTVNKVFETYIFEAFDMEYDTPKKDVVKRIKRYLKNTRIYNAVIAAKPDFYRDYIVDKRVRRGLAAAGLADIASGIDMSDEDRDRYMPMP